MIPINQHLATWTKPLTRRPTGTGMTRSGVPVLHSFGFVRKSPVGCRAVSSGCTFVLMADDELPDELGDEFDESDLHFAAQDGDMTRVRQLLADGRSPNAFDEISKTPLHYAAECGHVEIMRVLLEAGADVNACEEARIGNTPLREVADECSLAVATFLVDSGADPRIPGWMQLTALHMAEKRKDQEGQRVYALLKSVADRLRDS